MNIIYPLTVGVVLAAAGCHFSTEPIKFLLLAVVLDALYFLK